MADIFSYNPYPRLKTINPTSHHCDPCDKTMKFGDKVAHERGKKHRDAVAAKDNKAKLAAGHGGNGTVDATPAFNANGCRNCGQEG